MDNLTSNDLWNLKWDADRNAGYKEPFSFTPAEANELNGVPKVVILPSQGTDDATESLWYPWMKEQFKLLGIPCVVTTFPDPMNAREKLWLPFVMKCIGIDETTILIGHDAGAVCSLRILEQHILVKGIVLLSAHYTDLGDGNKRKSGYFNRPWDWGLIKSHASWILQFHSKDDNVIPVSEGRTISEKVNSDYHELDNFGHFEATKLPEIFEIIKKKIQG